MAHYAGLIEKYRDRLPVGEDTPVISLCEGNTPLIELKHLPHQVRLLHDFMAPHIFAIASRMPAIDGLAVDLRQ